MPRYDAIIIPGGGLRAGGQLPDYVKRRFDLALELESGEPIVPLSAWTTHRPAMLDAHGRPLWESSTGAQYLLDRGIPASRIFCESTSYDTIGNAYFSRVQFAEPMGWRSLLVITSEFHMPRTEAIFRWIYSLDAPGVVHLDFAATPDIGLTDTALTARRQREAASLESIERLRCRLTTLPALARWIFTEHDAYNALRPPAHLDDKSLLESY